MNLPDPIHNPGAPGFSQQQLQSIQPFIQDSMPNTRVLSTNSGEQYWKITLEYSQLLVSEYNTLTQQIDKTIQRGEKLLVWLPQYEDWNFKLQDYSVLSQSQYVVTLNSQGLRALPTIGSLIQFSNHQKVYRITQFTIGENTISVEIYPSLRVPVAQGVTTKFTSIRFSMDFLDRSQPLTGGTYNSDGYYNEGITLELRESI